MLYVIRWGKIRLLFDVSLTNILYIVSKVLIDY